jgi:hypothetical protein
MRIRKTPTTEKKRPVFKAKPKRETYEVKEKEHEIHFFMEIPYILIGWPGFETPYAVDDKGVISYELTAVLRKLLDNQTDS